MMINLEYEQPSIIEWQPSFSVPDELPVDFKPMKQPLNYRKFLTVNLFSCIHDQVLQLVGCITV